MSEKESMEVEKPTEEAKAESKEAAVTETTGEKKEEQKGPLDAHTALEQVLRISLYHDGLARGLRESVKALDRHEAHLCVLATSCNEPSYSRLITALCTENSIPLVKVEDNKILGKWVGLCRYNSEGKPVKVVGCTCAVIKSWGEESDARQFILDHIKSM
eukprot:TRINITY_DN672_c0_g1_i1.p1 TRINITY_DN672_c0_g1~~TRINITY_DN672_c0_g1_i1.p1  ORF type:complete len:160 (-),score=44.80 TRINITY_DN672_c0_g1_i1:252-731(-)